ncbi:hypothetical protein CEP53_015320 [Fusarium sp. AF-6]|nr:hypothetical protein CEP53_015320 [Fusarium sp. AF-6]
MAPNNVLVNHPFLQEDLPLASLVCDLQSPIQDAYISADLIENDWSVTPLKDYSAFVEEGRQSLFQTAVSTFFSLISNAKNDERIQVFAPEARKYTLLQPQAQFRKLCQTDHVREWIRDNYNRDLFIVVGYLTMTGATVVRRRSSSREVQASLDADVPVSDAAAPGDLHAQATAQIDQNSLDSVVYKADGEQIFSICYRKLKFSWFNKESTLEGSNRWELFTSNRGSRRAIKRFVEIDVDKRDFVPVIPHQKFEGPEENYVVPKQLPCA